MVMDSIREGVKKPWAKVLIFAIVISFVGAGYFTSTFFLGDPNAAAVVNGDSISVQDFQRAYSRTKQQYGEAFKQFIKTEEQEKNFRENVLQNLISRKVTVQMAEELGMRISTGEIRKTIQSMEALQAEGAYSADLLDQALRNIGMSRQQFKKSMESDLVLQQISGGISGSEFVLPLESQNDYKIMGQLRTGRALQIKYSLFDAAIEIGDEEINTYYDENKELFRVEEKVSVDYIELSSEQLQANIEVSDEQVAEYYNDNLDQFQSDEQKRVSHILIELGDDEDAALVKAQALKTRLDAGEDFVELVKSESSDEFSAQNDGDLGVVAEGDMEEPFEEAMTKLLKIGDISAPIKTSFGYHIIKLTEFVASETQTIEEVKVQIIAAVKKQIAEEAFYEKSQLLEEKSFEITDSLAEVAKLIDIEVKTSPVFSKRKATGLFANLEVKDAAFSDKVIQEQLNSDLITIKDNHVMVLRLREHKPSEIQALDLVKDQVVASLKSSKAKLAAIEFGDLIKTKLQAKEEIGEMIAVKNLAWKDLDKVQRTSAALPYLQLQSFFKLNRPEQDKNVIDSMEDSSEYVVFVLNNVENGSLDKAEKTLVTQTEQRLNRFYGEAEYGSLVEHKRSQASVTRNEQNIER